MKIYQNELDRLNKKEIAMINAMSKEGEQHVIRNSNGTPDVLEIEKLTSSKQ